MKRLLTVLALFLVIAGAVVFFLPGLMERSAALWLRHHASRSGLVVSFIRIRAPLLRPMVIEDLHLTRPARDGQANLELIAPRLELTFNLASAMGVSHLGHPVRRLRARHLVITVGGRAASPASFDWNALSWLLPDEFDLQADRIHFEQPLSHLQMESVQLSSNSSARPGLFAIGTIDFRAPLFHQVFSDVHGVTRWQNNRLALAAIRLRDGLNLDSILFDLTRLAEERVGLELSSTIFGGSMRLNLATGKTEQTRLWEGAASLNGISLAQLSGALGATEKITGTVRASKLTFRGDPRDFGHATASAWIELTGFSWRQRHADQIMLGANFFNRTVQLQELFLKQQANEITLAGETALGSDWLNPDFHGEISGTINELGQLAELFGRPASDFAGKIGVRGHVHTYGRRVDGEVALTGDALTLFRVPIDLLTARLAVDSSRLKLTQLDLERGQDFLRGSGEMELDRDRTFTFSAEANGAEVADYNLAFPVFGKLAGPLRGTLKAKGDGSEIETTLELTTNELNVTANSIWSDDAITFSDLQFSKDGITIPLSGEIDLSDRHHVIAAFTSPFQLRADLPETNCLRGVRLAPVDAGITFTKIEFDGREMIIDGQPRAQICHESEAGMPVTLSVIPLPAPLPVSP